MAVRTSLRDYQRELAERLKGAAAGGAASRLGVQAGAEAWLVSLADAGEVIPAPAITPVLRAACSRLASLDWNARSASRLAMSSERGLRAGR